MTDRPVINSRTRRPEARPAEILAAALDLFAEKGFSATRMEDVAARAGLSKAAIYLYFKDKMALLKALVNEMAGANLAVAKSTTEPTGVASESGNTNSLDLQAQYSLALAPQFVLGLGVTLGTGNNNAGTFSLTGTEVSTKNRTAFDIIPGYAISNSMMLFGKVSALSADGASTTAGVETKKSISGVGYGFGLRGLIDKNMFYQLGYDINKYNDVDFGTGNVKASSSVFSLGVDYKF